MRPSNFLYSLGCRVLIGVSLLPAVVVSGATVEGSTTGVFISPVPQQNAALSGVGTASFSWGTGNPSRLTFTGTSVATEVDQYVRLGHIYYYNGTISSGTGADGITISITLTLTLPSAGSLSVQQTMQLINTVNTSDPIESADVVMLPLSFPSSAINVSGFEYSLVVLGFGSVSGAGFAGLDRFFVLEQDSASADLWGKLSRKCPADSPQSEIITGYGTCPPLGDKNPTWGTFGSRSTLSFDSGESLRIQCANNTFAMWYSAPWLGSSLRVGTCPFYGGCNSAEFLHSGDNDGNDNPDCLLRTRWVSRDYGGNDIHNLWLDEWEWSELLHPYLDWAETVCDMASGRVSKTDYKYEYTYGPPVSCPATGTPEGVLVRTITVDPILGPETEAFFDAIDEGLASVPADEREPMGVSDTRRGDINMDGFVDALDVNIFRASIGACRETAAFRPSMDGDFDGCITAQDETLLFGDSPPTTIAGDLDGDGDVDLNDLNIILRARNQPATGVNDPRDLDHDGKITVLDGRKLTTLFTRPGGATQ